MKTYAKVITPLKFGEYLSYLIPEELEGKVSVGSRVKVAVKYISCIAVVVEITPDPRYESDKIKSIIEVENYPLIRESEIDFWKSISNYYLCTIDEVYKAADPVSLKPNKTAPDTKPVTSDEKPHLGAGKLATLSPVQQEKLDEIKKYHSQGKTVLLDGVTGSGKTEIYIHLIKECLERGKNALYLLPEVAVSRQLSHRLEKIFGDDMMIFHSRESIAKRKAVISALASDHSSSHRPKLILGLRSALFLPFDNLGLIIVDEEHDSSYKQSDPAPRYNGRDCAIMLGRLMHSDILLGSATPSFESLYNVSIGRYSLVTLNEKYHHNEDASVEIVDMRKESKKRAVKGSFSLTLIQKITQVLEEREQVMIFRARRAYSPTVQCNLCGEIPKCPRCNIHLTYHKFNNSLKCHYCGYEKRLRSDLCPSCGEGKLLPLGAGTERIEEELHELFPKATIARYDADTAKTKTEGDKILKNFAKGETDILVGTQMISKGFDFDHLSLVVVIQGETITSVNDFRSDEKAFQLLTQLRGRAGRRGKKGCMLIQTLQPDHPVYKSLTDHSVIVSLLSERKEFDFPPFVRLINIIIKDSYQNRCRKRAEQVLSILSSLPVDHFSGPVSPPIDKIQNEYYLKFIIKLRRDKNLEQTKADLFKALSSMERDVIIDVDPI